ncbi:MAG: FtsX-like permease family protein [Tepidisphaeraceae bacterium]
MYKLLLILKYLRKRRIAWVSLVAVMLCTAMVLVVISVMGGWLRMFRETSHAMVGDLVVYRSSQDGFAHYQEMIDRIEALPEVKAAAPEIHTYGLVNIADQIRTYVQVVGCDLKKMQNVNGLVKSLYLQKDVLAGKADEYDREAQSALPDDAAALRANAAALRQKAANFPSWDLPLSADAYRDTLPAAKTDVSKWPGMVVGRGVIGLRPDDNGVVDRTDYMYHAWVRLTVLNSAQGEDVTADNRAIRSYWIIDDSHTGVFQVDENSVYVPFELLQKDLAMDAQDYTDATSGEKLQTPARCNEIAIGLKEGFDPNVVKPKIEQVVAQMVRENGDLAYTYDPLTTQTWEERQADFLSAVEHEKSLLVVLFAIISVVAIFLIFCIFFMIVVEKTRDIGIIKSVGATGTGVMAIFLGYGLAIGLVGAGMGLLLGYLVVHNINQLQQWMSDHLGVKIWSAKTYVFDTIPNTLDRHDVLVIVTVAVLSAVAGALVPAIRAARMNPVEALRWE